LCGLLFAAVALYSVCWSLDGSQLAASGANGAVYMYDYAKGIAVKKWQLHTQMSLKVKMLSSNHKRSDIL
jgi:WD40 repeat protein